AERVPLLQAQHGHRDRPAAGDHVHRALEIGGERVTGGDVVHPVPVEVTHPGARDPGSGLCGGEPGRGGPGQGQHHHTQRHPEPSSAAGEALPDGTPQNRSERHSLTSICSPSFSIVADSSTGLRYGGRSKTSTPSIRSPGAMAVRSGSLSMGSCCPPRSSRKVTTGSPISTSFPPGFSITQRITHSWPRDCVLPWYSVSPHRGASGTITIGSSNAGPSVYRLPTSFGCAVAAAGEPVAVFVSGVVPRPVVAMSTPPVTA